MIYDTCENIVIDVHCIFILATWGYDNQNNQNLYVMDLANLQTEINPFNS